MIFPQCTLVLCVKLISANDAEMIANTQLRFRSSFIIVPSQKRQLPN